MAAGMNVAVVGVTGAVGQTTLKILEERKFPVKRPAGLRVRALRRQDRDLQGRDDPGREGRPRRVQGRRHRVLLRGLGAVEGVRAPGGEGGRRRGGQVERVPDGPRGAARGPRDQCPRGARPPGHRRLPELHDHRHRDAAQAAARRGAPPPGDRHELSGGVRRRRATGSTELRAPDARVGAGRGRSRRSSSSIRSPST